jgi:hypothetical protein
MSFKECVRSGCCHCTSFPGAWKWPVSVCDATLSIWCDDGYVALAAPEGNNVTIAPYLDARRLVPTV